MMDDLSLCVEQGQTHKRSAQKIEMITQLHYFACQCLYVIEVYNFYYFRGLTELNLTT